MIVYEGTKVNFMADVRDNLICNKIYNEYKKYFGNTNKGQIDSWQNSMQYMRNVLDTEQIPNDAGVAIEYNIPTTSRRVDFILTGIGRDTKRTAVIVELKQWQDCDSIEDEGTYFVETFVGGAKRNVAHPSYQAYSYAKYIDNYIESAQNGKIDLVPCAFLHNYHIKKDGDPLLNERYKNYIEAAPVFGAEDFVKLRQFLTKHIKSGDDGKTIYIIDHGRLRPSKSLQDCLASMLDGNEEFIMLDDQKIAYDTIFEIAKKSVAFNNKNVIVIEGGPGTGKSVLAINLLANLINIDVVAFYVTKNGTPRSIYKKKLQEAKRDKAFIDSCFQNSGNFYQTEENSIDVLLVDEAHRLSEKSGLFSNLGENQIKEIIKTAKCAVFFIDETQKVTLKDVGTVGDIKKYADEFGANYHQIKLGSQFRCNGSDGYITWLNDVLEIESATNFTDLDFKYDFRIFDDPNALKEAIVEKNNSDNKSRIVAGYCWDWKKDENDNTEYHDIVIPEYDFGMSWNLNKNSQVWAISKGSVNEAGCIHTCQGIEFEYVGVIIGDDLRYDSQKGIITDVSKRASTDQSVKGWKKRMAESPEETLEEVDKIIKNTYKVLMTRGMKGCYVYCTDKNLQEYLKKRAVALFGKN